MKSKIVPIAIAGIIALALAWSIFDSLTGSINPSFSWSLLAQGTLLIVIVVGGWSALRKGNPTGARMTFYAFATVFTIGGALAFVYGPAKTKTMVTEITGDYVEKTAFDLRSGEPLTMGYLNLNGKWQNAYDPETGEILTPADCRPKGSHHFDKSSGIVFPYSTEGTCFSPVAGGVRLTPISTEDLKTSEKSVEVTRVNPANPPQRVEKVLKTITLESDPVPHCGAGWVEMDFPPEAEFKVWWNYAAADFEWLIEGKDEWQTEYAPTVAKMRACSKIEAYDGDRMKVTFKGYDL